MQAVADCAEITQPFVSTLERGTRNPSRDMVERIARALSPEDADDHTFRALHNAGLAAAGFINDGAPGPLETIVSEAGYSPDDFDDDARARLRQNIDAVIIGIAEQEKQKRGKR